jgi:6,7-dimethyl-8-ribityllumazine synthase
VNNVPRAFVLVASQFNSKYVQGLIEHCTDELRSLSPTSSVNLVMVPGAFEIPLVVREIALKKEADAIVALGVILEGDTSHARQLGDTVTHSLQQISLEHGLPVIHVVLSLKDEEQAKKRCLENEMNRGTEAARAALAMTNVLAELRR